MASEQAQKSKECEDKRKRKRTLAMRKSVLIHFEITPRNYHTAFSVHGHKQQQQFISVFFSIHSPSPGRCDHKLVDQAVVLIALQSRKLCAVVKRVVNQFLVISAHIEHDREHTMRRDPTHSAVQS